MNRCHVLVARDFGKYFVTRDSVRPDNDEKWPSLMAQRKVDWRGLKVHSWRKAASSIFVSAFRGFWDGWKLRDVVRGTEVWMCVEFKLRC